MHCLKKEPYKYEYLNENSSCKVTSLHDFDTCSAVIPELSSVLRDLGRLLLTLQLLTDHCSCRVLDTDLC